MLTFTVGHHSVEAHENTTHVCAAPDFCYTRADARTNASTAKFGATAAARFGGATMRVFLYVCALFSVYMCGLSHYSDSALWRYYRLRVWPPDRCVIVSVSVRAPSLCVWVRALA